MNSDLVAPAWQGAGGISYRHVLGVSGTITE